MDTLPVFSVVLSAISVGLGLASFILAVVLIVQRDKSTRSRRA